MRTMATIENKRMALLKGEHENNGHCRKQKNGFIKR